MSSLALMRWLESAPERYDAGMRWITLGRVDALRAAVADAAVSAPGHEVLEVGCGTGALTSLLVERGARVTAFDQSPAMLEIARAQLPPPGDARVEWHERTASEIDALPASHYDAVVSSFALSEMSRAERGFVLRAAAERLRAGGCLALADEVRPPDGLRRFAVACARVPQAVLAWLVAGSLSRPIPDIAAEVEEAGLRVISERRWLLGSLGVLVAERPV